MIRLRRKAWAVYVEGTSKVNALMNCSKVSEDKWPFWDIRCRMEVKRLAPDLFFF